MLKHFDEEYQKVKMPEDDIYQSTNDIIGMALIIKLVLSSPVAKDIDYERYELENFLNTIIPNLENAFSGLLNMMYSEETTLSIKSIDNFIIQLKLMAVYEHLLKKIELN